MNIASKLTMAAVAALSASTALGAVQFSADTVQAAPQGQSITGKRYVGEGRERTEASHGGQNMVQILDSVQGVSYLVFPEQKAYTEIRVPAASPKTGPQADPCAGIQGVTCRKLGPEPVNGRPATKWEMAGGPAAQGKTITSWIDDERGLPLRMQYSDGGALEAKMLGKDQHEGRTVEKWETVMTRAGQQPVRMLEWVAPDLGGVTVKQQGPDGSSFELKNIKVGPQPAELFAVPAGFQKVAPPQQGGAQGAPAAR